MSHALYLFYRIAVVCGCVASAQRIVTTPEPTTLDWWGPFTADMRAETSNVYHSRGEAVGSTAATSAGHGVDQESQKAPSGSSGRFGLQTAFSTTETTSERTTKVFESTVERPVNAQPASPPAHGSATTLNATSTLSSAPSTIRRPASWALAVGVAVVIALL